MSYVLCIGVVHIPCLVLFNHTIRPKFFLEHPCASYRFVAIRTINDHPSSIKHNRNHLTSYCFLLIVSVRRDESLLNSSRSVIDEVFHVVITKGLCSPVILLKIFHMSLLIVFYKNTLFIQ